jgi:histidine ammonia-lyase
MTQQDQKASTAGARIILDGETLNLEDVITAMNEDITVTLSSGARERIEASRDALEEIVAHHTLSYGIQTGFGKLCNTRIDDAQLEQLQENLIKSHASGYGEPLPQDIVRGMLLIRTNTLAKGYSGVRVELVEALMKLMSAGVVPVVPRYGSLGASGDLAPLAHVALLLLGRGQAWHRGHLLEGKEALIKAGLQPLTLKAKEGLALINGTPLMAALGCHAVSEARRLLKLATLISAVSIDALLGTDACFSPALIGQRPHPGIIKVAEQLQNYLMSSPLRQSHVSCGRVQDPYSMRCTPQVLGAVWDVVENAAPVFSIEINSATDNPLIIRNEAGEAVAVSGGNFHGEPLAFQLDFLAIALAELGSISERRVNLLLDNELDQLPEFLIEDGGLNSGFMISHYTAAALVSRNKQLANPASTDSLPTSANQEDHVSMGANAGLKLLELIDNLKGILSIELLCAVQALDFHEFPSSDPIMALREAYRETVPFIHQDTELHLLISRTKEFMENYDF